MRPPAVESAVQTTPPMTIAATIPAFPLRPATTSTKAVIIKVIMVIPLTGLVPTMAIAFAATVVKRKDITVTIRSPSRACHILFTTPPKAKKQKTASRVKAMPQTRVFIGMSSWVRSAAAEDPPLRLNSLAARPTALLMTPALLMMPMTPAVAIPPMPMWRAYSLKIWSADISETVVVMPMFIRSMTSPPQMRFISGMMTSHTRKEPQQMMKAYLRPTM